MLSILHLSRVASRPPSRRDPMMVFVCRAAHSGGAFHVMPLSPGIGLRQEAGGTAPA